MPDLAGTMGYIQEREIQISDLSQQSLRNHRNASIMNDFSFENSLTQDLKHLKALLKQFSASQRIILSRTHCVMCNQKPDASRKKRKSQWRLLCYLKTHQRKHDSYVRCFYKVIPHGNKVVARWMSCGCIREIISSPFWLLRERTVLYLSLTFLVHLPSDPDAPHYSDAERPPRSGSAWPVVSHLSL